jgi:hypothetical protein
MLMQKKAKADVRPRRQKTQYTCMATSLAMCFSALGHDISEDSINKVLGAEALHGAGWEQALNTAQYFGKRCVFVMPCTIEQLKEWTDQGIPVLIAWNPEGRPWSHASVVFDVSKDMETISIADPNIPDPDVLFREIPKDEFYKKWFENAGNYLIRRPAIAVFNEVDEKGMPANKIPHKKQTKQASKPYSGNPNKKPIYPVEIDHGIEEPLSGGTNIIQNLTKDLKREQGRKASAENLYIITTGNNYFRKAEPSSKSIASEPSYWRDYIEEGDSWALYLVEGLKDSMAEKVLTQDILSHYDNGFEVYQDILKNSKNVKLLRKGLPQHTKLAGTGLYGFNKRIENSVLGCVKRLEKSATKIAKRYYKKDEKIASFLLNHSKKAGSLPAKILASALKNQMPKLASTKEATKMGLYGFSERTANLGLMACLELRHQAGIAAYDLHHRKKEEDEYIRSFIANHCKNARCNYSKLLKISYPDNEI